LKEPTAVRAALATTMDELLMDASSQNGQYMRRNCQSFAPESNSKNFHRAHFAKLSLPSKNAIKGKVLPHRTKRLSPSFFCVYT
jgi:hypothetical protein